MPSMTMDLVKRVDRLPKPTTASLAMQPLFEAIMNSIHSTQAMFDNVSKEGKIVVTVVTGRRQARTQAIVEDNGIGLDSVNYNAFMTTDTPNKVKIGGKGVGRLLWLDCFENIHINSSYFENAILMNRSFDFKLCKDEQIQNLVVKTSENLSRNSGVTVKFDGLKDNGYRQKFPGRAAYIFQHITSHFLPTFIGNKSPNILVHCTSGGKSESKEFPGAISDLIYRREDITEAVSQKFGSFSITLMECDKIVSSDLIGNHFIHFIAHDRTVLSQRIDSKLGIGTFGDDCRRVFHACIFGQYLDDNVNQERTNFNFDNDITDLIINEVCVQNVAKFLVGPLSALKSDQEKIVEDIIKTYPSVAFGGMEELQKYIPLANLVTMQFMDTCHVKDFAEMLHKRKRYGKFLKDCVEEPSAAKFLQRQSQMLQMRLR